MVGSLGSFIKKRRPLESPTWGAKSVGWNSILILACVSCMIILTCVSSMFILECVSLHDYLVARSALSVFSQFLVQWMPVSGSVLASALFSEDFTFPARGISSFVSNSPLSIPSSLLFSTCLGFLGAFDPLYINKVVPKLNMSLFNHFNLVDVTLACDDDQIQAHKCFGYLQWCPPCKKGV